MSYEYTVNDTLKREKGTKNLRSFFENIVKNFADESLKFYKVWNEFPFVYKERQVNSALIPAIYQYTKTIGLEQPFKKRTGEQRFLDIVTHDQKNTYFIELKHTYNSITDTIATRADEEWKTAIEQIKDINKRTLAYDYNYNDYNIFKIALMIMPMYVPSSRFHLIKGLELDEYHEKVIQEFDHRAWTKETHANMFGTIKIGQPTEYEHEWSNGKRIYPFISFIARVEKL